MYNKNVKRVLHFQKDSDLMENKIKDMRKEKKITQDDFAKSIGVTRQTIISLENGRYDASLKLAHKIAKYFGKNIEDIFIFEDGE